MNKELITTDKGLIEQLVEGLIETYNILGQNTVAIIRQLMPNTKLWSRDKFTESLTQCTGLNLTRKIGLLGLKIMETLYNQDCRWAGKALEEKPYNEELKQKKEQADEDKNKFWNWTRELAQKDISKLYEVEEIIQGTKRDQPYTAKKLLDTIMASKNLEKMIETCKKALPLFKGEEQISLIDFQGILNRTKKEPEGLEKIFYILHQYQGTGYMRDVEHSIENKMRETEKKGYTGITKNPELTDLIEAYIQAKEIMDTWRSKTNKTILGLAEEYGTKGIKIYKKLQEEYKIPGENDIFQGYRKGWIKELINNIGEKNIEGLKILAEELPKLYKKAETNYAHQMGILIILMKHLPQIKKEHIPEMIKKYLTQ